MQLAVFVGNVLCGVLKYAGEPGLRGLSSKCECLDQLQQSNRFREQHELLLSAVIQEVGRLLSPNSSENRNLLSESAQVS